MSRPIEAKTGQIFVPVTDMARAIAWYSHLFGLPAGTPSHGGTIYDVPLRGETGLTLDSTRPAVTNSAQPLCFFWTADIQAALHFLRAGGVTTIGEIADVGNVSILLFRDIDGNLPMICQRNG